MSNLYGFIITRHVNSELTNKYWNQSVKLIRTLYPLRKIVIIDDNSNQEFVKADFNYKNIEIVYMFINDKINNYFLDQKVDHLELDKIYINI